MAVRVSFLGIGIDAMTSAEAVAAIRERWSSGVKRRVFFVNAHCVNTAARDVGYRESLGMAELVLPDGSGVLLGSKLLNVPLRHNLNGTDLVPLICEAAAEDGLSLFLLGAQPGVAEAAAEQLELRFPRLRIAGVQHGFFAPEESDRVIERINASGADILLVALGVPIQELWITEHFTELRPSTSVAVGALFDFLSARVPRAPEFFRRHGIEWLYRLYHEPRRLWRRYVIGNVAFMARVSTVRAFKYGILPAPVSARGSFPAPRAVPVRAMAAAEDDIEDDRVADVRTVPIITGAPVLLGEPDAIAVRVHHAEAPAREAVPVLARQAEFAPVELALATPD